MNCPRAGSQDISPPILFRDEPVAEGMDRDHEVKICPHVIKIGSPLPANMARIKPRHWIIVRNAFTMQRILDDYFGR